MAFPQFYGAAVATFEADDDGTKPAICIEVNNFGCGALDREAWCALSVEDAAKLAEQIYAAIDLFARTAKARKEAREARIAALKETLAELETA